MPPTPSQRSPLKPGTPYRQTADKSVFSRPGKTVMYYRAPDLPRPEQSRKKSVQAFVNQLADAHVGPNEWEEVFEWTVHRTEDDTFAHIYGILANATHRSSLAQKLAHHAYFQTPVDEEDPPLGPCAETIRALACERRREADRRRSHGLTTPSAASTASHVAAANEEPKTQSGISTKRPLGAQEEDIGGQPTPKKAKASSDKPREDTTPAVSQLIADETVSGKRDVTGPALTHTEPVLHIVSCNETPFNILHAKGESLATEKRELESAARTAMPLVNPSAEPVLPNAEVPVDNITAPGTAAKERYQPDHLPPQLPEAGPGTVANKLLEWKKKNLRGFNAELNAGCHGKQIEEKNELKKETKTPIPANEKSTLDDKLYEDDHRVKMEHTGGSRRKAENERAYEEQEGQSVPDRSTSKCQEGLRAKCLSDTGESSLSETGESSRGPVQSAMTKEEDAKTDMKGSNAPAQLTAPAQVIAPTQLTAPAQLTFPDVFPARACIMEPVPVTDDGGTTQTGQILLSGAELNEDIVEFYGSRLGGRAVRLYQDHRNWMNEENGLVLPKRMVVVPPSISRRLMQAKCNYEEAGIESDDYTALMKEAQVVLMPMHLAKDNCWVLIIADLICDQVILFDCVVDERRDEKNRLYPAAEVLTSFCRGVRDAMLGNDRDKRPRTRTNLDLDPRDTQFGGSTWSESVWPPMPQLPSHGKDSGVLVCQAMDCIIRSMESFWFEPQHIPNIRRMMALECSKGILLHRKTDRKTVDVLVGAL